MSKDTGQSGQAGALPTHGAATLPSVIVDSYNLEIEDEDGFVGDKASKGAFRQILEKWRKPFRDLGADPLGDKPSDEIPKSKLDALLAKGEPEAAGVVQSAIEDYAQQLAKVLRRFLRLKAWRDTEYIAVGGGFPASRLGSLAVGRCTVLLKSEGIPIEIGLIRHDPNEAGLIGAGHLLPAWMLAGYNAMLAVDIGGTNIRAGIVALNQGKARDLSKAVVTSSQIWRHGEEEVTREETVKRLARMLADLVKDARKTKLDLVPVVGVGCPGLIEPDGSIATGAQNLPGNWESARFNLPRVIHEELPQISGHDTMVVMHNDAVVQGLSQLPFLQDYQRWGIVTIGTGLGNARFTNREPRLGKEQSKAKD
jgi:hypothetical protein